uniref:Response regulator receiver protein n=1 Tax=uncultured Verrucomicrobiota bacterium TaxID=156588 RepID=D2DXX3_9BACT|nr:response regulator receiver protein [uncultured Verrucomicrobiota bacterium]
MAHKILVIDDAPATARITEAVLQQHFPGCDVLSASRGIEGFERLHMATPDLVLLNDKLPDMEAEAVLARLQSDPANSQLPVFLLVDPANGAEFNGRYPGVTRVLTKPVSQETLRAALTEILSGKPGARRVLPSRGGIVFSGHTGFISLRQALHMAQSDRLTGVLRFQLGRHPIELWMNGGRFVFATTKNAQLYCGGSPVILSATNLGLILEAQINQQVTGCPIFLYLSARNGFPHEDVMQIVRDHGQRLFGQLYTAGRTAFEFEETERIPDFAKNFQPSAEDVDNWILAGLRHVRFEQLSPAQRPDPNGDPAYTRKGYDLIQRLKLNDVEARFASAISGTETLQAIAQKIGVPLNDALLIVFRFLALEIIDFWNPGVLALPPGQ